MTKDKTPGTHGYMMANGKHKGERITRVPVSYLRWMVNANHSEAVYAAAELHRRGTVYPEIEISGHAIDRASTLCLAEWRLHRHGEEGLHAWMQRSGLDAYRRLKDGHDAIHHVGVRWIFAKGEHWPTLKTVMRSGRE